jgi:protein-S-isoprenylcysteine O-methyltransferase Ste14
MGEIPIHAEPIQSFLFFLLYQIMVQYEERMCEEMYEDKFIEYKNSTPKNFIFF